MFTRRSVRPISRSVPVRQALLVVAVAALTTACLPAAPAAGRPGPVRKVALIGDSLTFGLFGTTPAVTEALRSKLAVSGVSLSVDGGPGDTLATPWPGRPTWAELLQARIDRDDPDVIIVQSMLFPGSDNPANHDPYYRAALRLLDIAQSRGAHVYFVQHHRPNDAVEFNAAVVAETIQSHAAEGRGVGFIPLNWWLDHCQRPFASDGWHLSAAGSQCWANAANAAVNQLRNEIG